MAHPSGGHESLAKVMDRLRAQGCRITELSGEIVGEDGPFKVRYATNPKTGDFVTLPMVPDDAPLWPSVVMNIERRLGLGKLDL